MAHDHEPSLDDILSDPVVVALMDRDGVSRNALRILIADIRRARRALRPATGCSASEGAGCPC
jgi:hypothetical protein